MTSRAPAVASPAARSRPRRCSAWAVGQAISGVCCRCIRGRPHACSCPRATSCSAAAARSPTACAPRREPCTSVTATPRFATPGTSRRAPWQRRRGRCARCWRAQLRRIRRWDLAASRARGRLHRHLRAQPRTDPALLRPRRDRRPPPVETHRFAPGKPGDELLRRLRDRAPQARATWRSRPRAARGAPIRVVGSGPEHAALARSLSRGGRS